MRLMMTIAAVLCLALPASATVDIKEVNTPGGLTAWLVKDQSIPFMALEIRFRGGASLDVAGKRGATNLMTGLLDEGAGDMDARAFARSVEGLAASISFGVDDDALSVSARFLTENRDEAVALLRAAMLEPRFDADAIERVREQVISGIESDAKDPDALASRAMDQMMFGDHPYATNLSGTVSSVEALTRDDLVEAHRNLLARDRIYIGAVGDITEEDLAALLDGLLGALPEEGAPMPPRANVEISGGITVVPFETPQSVARFAQKGIKLDHPDYFTAVVLNHVLGGGSFESRLMDEVRAKRGLTYGVYSYLAGKDLAEVYIGSVSSANDRIAEAIEVIRDEWEKAATEGVTAQEVENAKTFLTGAYPLRFDGNGPIANIMVGMQMLGLPIDYIATRNERVEAVTVEGVKRVAGELLEPENLHFVVVGQPVGLETTPGN
ncbi:M16 family metallopeptidase [Roseobacter denitrificans]|uniref:Peptidase, M16 family, putative n=1 Tax=Roseobacter denitrificans (strain ATCC 33942 / OCh 114) TaxID=375451 RepID=Q16CD6_ROSDO|nr:peptidase, M16 family, putative [Roseobacter denitrificans OCh 114]